MLPAVGWRVEEFLSCDVIDTSYDVKRISEVPEHVNVIRLYQMHVSASAVMLDNHPDIQSQPLVIR